MITMTESGAKIELFFVRHGETAINREKRLQGRSNAPLNKRGEQQAEQVRAFFAENGVRFGEVYASPLKRAEQTARIISGEKTEIRKDDRLLEMDYGPYEGVSLNDLPPELIRFFQDFVHNPVPDGMESLADVTRRLGGFIECLKETARGSVLVVTHAVAMRGALEYLTPESHGSFWPIYIGPCSVYHTSFDGNGFSAPKEVFSLAYEPGV